MLIVIDWLMIVLSGYLVQVHSTRHGMLLLPTKTGCRNESSPLVAVACAILTEQMGAHKRWINARKMSQRESKNRFKKCVKEWIREVDVGGLGTCQRYATSSESVVEHNGFALNDHCKGQTTESTKNRLKQK